MPAGRLVGGRGIPQCISWCGGGPRRSFRSLVLVDPRIGPAGPGELADLRDPPGRGGVHVCVRGLGFPAACRARALDPSGGGAAATAPALVLQVRRFSLARRLGRRGFVDRHGGYSRGHFVLHVPVGGLRRRHAHPSRAVASLVRFPEFCRILPANCGRSHRAPRSLAAANRGVPAEVVGRRY